MNASAHASLLALAGGYMIYLAWEMYKAMRDGMKSLLRINLEKECERCQREKWCGPVKRSSIVDMYTSYTGLGGNGSVTSLVDQTLSLPAIPPEEGDKDD